MTAERGGLNGGQLLALGDEHRRGLHRTPVADCTKCFLKDFGLSAEAPVKGEAAGSDDPARTAGEPDGSDRFTGRRT